MSTRIDEPTGALVFNNTFNYYFTGAGVHIYVFDTGIDRNNSDVAGLISSLAVCTHTPGCDPYVDTYGHGTGVAAIAASAAYGVAKGATLHSVRVADGEGVFVSNIGAGLDWLRSNGIQPGVANISLGDQNGDLYIDDGIPRFLSEKIGEAISAGYVVVKAAGNSGEDACTQSQDTQANEIVVAASDITDHRSVWAGGFSSAYGSCVSLFAPGTNVATTSNPLGNSFSGTSASAPIVSGVAAQILQEQPDIGPGGVLSQLQISGNRVINDPSTPNNFLVNSLHQTASIGGPTNVLSTDVSFTVVYHMTPHGGDPNNRSFVWFEQNHTNFATQATASGNTYTRTIHPGESGWTSITSQYTSAGKTITQSITLNIAPDGTCSPNCH